VLGEEVGAVIQLRSGSGVSEEELRRHVAERIAAFKVPVRFWVRNEPLPRNPSGKILKRDLRDALVGSGVSG
jgi:long-chain acyl-CoA synthetase